MVRRRHRRARVLRVAVAVAAGVAIYGALASAAMAAADAPGGAPPNGERGAALRREVRARDYFSERDIERARRYRGPRYALGLTATAAGLLLLAAMGLGPGSRRLGGWAARATGGRWWLEALLLTAVVVAALVVVRLPFSVASFLHDRRFGLATQTIAGYLGDVGKGVAVQLLLGAGTALGFFALARALPRAWPLAAAAAAAALAFALAFVFPLVYEPMFNRFTPVDAATRARVVALAERSGVGVRNVLRVDASRRTTRLNAYVSGIGATKRVVLYDTLLERAPPEEVDLIVAHELAHQAHRDVLRGTALAAGGSVLVVLLIRLLLSSAPLTSSLGVAGAGDPRSIPFLALVITAAGLLTLPVQNAVSRRMEAAADRAAVQVTEDPDTAVRVEVRLALRNISDIEPHPLLRWALFTHPPVLERIAIALEWKERHGRPP